MTDVLQRVVCLDLSISNIETNNNANTEDVADEKSPNRLNKSCVNKERKAKSKNKLDERIQLHSETQRIIRESRVQLPYHKPAKQDLTSFLAKVQQKRETFGLTSSVKKQTPVSSFLTPPPWKAMNSVTNSCRSAENFTILKNLKNNVKFNFSNLTPSLSSSSSSHKKSNLLGRIKKRFSVGDEDNDVVADNDDDDLILNDNELKNPAIENMLCKLEKYSVSKQKQPSVVELCTIMKQSSQDDSDFKVEKVVYKMDEKEEIKGSKLIHLQKQLKLQMSEVRNERMQERYEAFKKIAGKSSVAIRLEEDEKNEEDDDGSEDGSDGGDSDDDGGVVEDDDDEEEMAVEKMEKSNPYIDDEADDDDEEKEEDDDDDEEDDGVDSKQYKQIKKFNVDDNHDDIDVKDDQLVDNDDDDDIITVKRKNPANLILDDDDGTDDGVSFKGIDNSTGEKSELSDKMSMKKSYDLFDEDAMLDDKLISGQKDSVVLTPRPFKELAIDLGDGVNFRSGDGDAENEEDGGYDNDDDIIKDSNTNTSFNLFQDAKSEKSFDTGTNSTKDNETSYSDLSCSMIPAGQKIKNKRISTIVSNTSADTTTTSSLLAMTNDNSKYNENDNDIVEYGDGSHSDLVSSSLAADSCGQDFNSQMLNEWFTDNNISKRSSFKSAITDLCTKETEKLLDENEDGNEDLLQFCSGSFGTQKEKEKIILNIDADDDDDDDLHPINDDDDVNHGSHRDKKLSSFKNFFCSEEAITFKSFGSICNDGRVNDIAIVGDAEGLRDMGDSENKEEKGNGDDDDVRDDDDDRDPSEKKKRKRIITDSDEGEGDDDDDTDNVEDDDEKKDDDDDDDKEDDDDEAGDEESHLLVRVKKGLLAAGAKENINRQFIEEEAELSGSEDGGGDDDDDGEVNDDVMEREEGDDDDVGTEEELRNQVHKVHLKMEIDQDKRELRLLQEHLLEDGDMHEDGMGRMRRFRWNNTEEGVGDDDGGVEGKKSDDDNDDEDDEVNWRINRLEREKFLSQHGDDDGCDDNDDGTQSLDADDSQSTIHYGRKKFKLKTLCSSNSNNSQASQTSLDSKIKSKSSSTSLFADKKSSSSSTLSSFAKTPFFKIPDLKRVGSFLHRSKDTLARYSADNSTNNHSNDRGSMATMVSRNSKNFVFSTVFPVSENSNSTNSSDVPKIKKSIQPQKKKPCLDMIDNNDSNSSSFKMFKCIDESSQF